MSRGRMAVLVSNDLEHDQRVRKTCQSLAKAGWEPVLIGRRHRPEDAASIDRPYPTQRVYIKAQSGPRFYLALQRALGRALSALAQEGGVSAVWANDLDTLGPAVQAARRHGWSIAYDSHEWFTEAEGLKGKPIKRALWTAWEKRWFRGLERMLTVNEAIAEAYQKQGLEVKVVPNVPELLPPAEPMPRSELGWPEKAPVMLIQGAFMDKDRGALDAVRALVHATEVHLALIGAGPEHEQAMPLAKALGVDARLHVHDKMAFAQLRRCTASADVGLSLDRPTAGNFLFSLPNKLFDSLHAGLPLVCSDLPVAGQFVKDHGCGKVVREPQAGDGASHEAQRAVNIAEAVLEVLSDPPSSDQLAAVAAKHHWGAFEEQILWAVHPVR